MILIDTSILSTFSRVGALELLESLFPRDALGISPAVFREVLTAIG